LNWLRSGAVYKRFVLLIRQNFLIGVKQMAASFSDFWVWVLQHLHGRVHRIANCRAVFVWPQPSFCLLHLLPLALLALIFELGPIAVEPIRFVYRQLFFALRGQNVLFLAILRQWISQLN